MPYRRQYKKSIRPKRQSQSWTRYVTPNNAQKALALAKASYVGVKYIKGLVNSEMLHTQGNATSNISSTGTVVHLSSIAQGDTSSGRTGNSILSRNLLLRIAIANNVSAVNTFHRVMLVWDTQQIGDTSPTISDILESVSYLSPLATATVGRFKILYTKTFSTNTVNNTNKIIDKYFNFNKHIRYNGTAGADIQKNGLYLVMLSDQAINTPTYFYQYKLGYHDN